MFFKELYCEITFAGSEQIIEIVRSYHVSNHHSFHFDGGCSIRSSLWEVAKGFSKNLPETLREIIKNAFPLATKGFAKRSPKGLQGDLLGFLEIQVICHEKGA